MMGAIVWMCAALALEFVVATAVLLGGVLCGLWAAVLQMGAM